MRQVTGGPAQDVHAPARQFEAVQRGQLPYLTRRLQDVARRLPDRIRWLLPYVGQPPDFVRCLPYLTRRPPDLARAWGHLVRWSWRLACWPSCFGGGTRGGLRTAFAPFSLRPVHD